MPTPHQQDYIDAAEAAAFATAGWVTPVSFGVSNRALIIQDGILAGVANADSWSSSLNGVILHCLFRFPPADEVYFSLVITTAKNVLFNRLQAMAGPSGLRLNNVRFYLADDGFVYLDRRSYLEAIDAGTRLGLAPPIDIDQILFSVYPPTPSAKRSFLVRDFVGYLAQLVGPAKVSEIRPWASSIMLPPKMSRMPSTISPSSLAQDIAALGGHYVGNLIERFHAALNHLERKHFVILTGISGTGKTSLVKRYAYAVHGLSSLADEDPFFVVAAVRPDWTDPSGLLGYHDVLSGKYVVTPFLQALLLATAYGDVPVFVCLDEMNLARVEFYFADVLSAMETEEPIHLHSNPVPLQGTDGEYIPSEIPLPKNLFIVGTVNIDESVQPITDKVLDRSNVIDVSEVDITGFLQMLGTREPSLRWSIVATSKLLADLEELLSQNRLGFGYRTAEELVRYCDFAVKSNALSLRRAIDTQLTQKILVKLRGGERQRQMLERLDTRLAQVPLAKGAIRDLIDQLDEFGSFQQMK